LKFYRNVVAPFATRKVVASNSALARLKYARDAEQLKNPVDTNKVIDMNSKIDILSNNIESLKPISNTILKSMDLTNTGDRSNLLSSIKSIYVAAYKPVALADYSQSLDKGNIRLANLKPKKFAAGGVVSGFGNTDSVHAMLTPGEFVMNKSAVEQIGVNNLAAIQKFANGGPVGANNANSAGGSGGFNMAGLVPALSGFTAPAGSLAAALNGFANTATELVNGLSKIPTSIALEGRHEVVVVINGLEALASLEPTMQKFVIGTVNRELDRYTEEKFPDSGRRI